MPEQTDPTSSQATPHSTDPFEEAYRNYLRAMKDAWAQYDVDAVNLRSHPMLPFGQAVPGLPCAPGHIAVNCRGHIARVEFVIHFRDSDTGNIDTNETTDRPLK
jgi:hypothetical protein